MSLSHARRHIRRRVRSGPRIQTPFHVAVTVILIAVASATLLAPRTASAHAVLIRSDPQAGATLQQPPKQLNLWFSEGLSRDLTTVHLLDSDGKDVGALQLTYNDADDRQVTGTVPEIGNGTYTIAWSSFSSVDGHRLDGSVPFGVGVSPTAAASSASSADFRPSSSEVAARWSSLVGALALGGVLTVVLVLGTRADGAADPRRLLMSLAIVAVAMLVTGDVAVLLLRADRAGGIGETWGVVTGSTWGHLWLARVNLSAFTAGAVVATLATFRRWFAVRVAAIAVLAAGVLLTESLSSHAATRTSNLPLIADFLHLAASSAWIGAVLALPALFLWSRSDLSGGRTASMVVVARRFALVALTSFGVILLTGIYRTIEEMPTLRSFVDTTYGKALMVKLALVLGMVALGGANFFLARTWDRQRTVLVWTVLTRSVRLEALVGAAIVVAVALMTLATPASSLVVRGGPAELAKISSVVRQRGTADDLNLDLTVQPSAGGGQKVSAVLARNGNASGASKPLVIGEGLGITQVRFRFKPLDAPIGESRVIVAQSGDDTYAVDGQFLPFKGRWEIDVDVRRKDADDTTAKFTIDTEQINRPAYVRTMADDNIVYSIAPAAGVPGLVLAAGGEFYQSIDAGATWRSIGGSGAYHVVADPTTPAGFFAAGPAGLLKSEDGGVSWQTLYSETGDVVSDVALDRDPRVLVIATRKGILRSADGGATWDLRLPSAPAEAGSSQPDQWSRLATASDGTMVAGRRPGVLAVSLDSGSTWQEAHSDLNLPGGVMGLMIDPANPRRWFVGSMGSGVWVSGDAGASWQRAKAGISPDGHGAGFIETADGKVIVATTGQGVLMTSDGTNWSQVGDDGIEQGIAEGVAVTKDGAGIESLLVVGIGIYRLDLDSSDATGGVASR